jgi:serine/threonine protein kinase
MELVDGGSLEALLGRDRLPFPITRRIIIDLLQALAHLHDVDVLHRDLSPCNVLISTSGSVKVADLGIARVMEHARPARRTIDARPGPVHARYRRG